MYAAVSASRKPLPEEFEWIVFKCPLKERSVWHIRPELIRSAEVTLTEREIELIIRLAKSAHADALVDKLEAVNVYASESQTKASVYAEG
jgi:hypothetical protein